MRKILIVLSSLVVMLGVICSCAGDVQKQLKPLRTLIKDKKGNDAVKLAASLAKDSVLALEPKVFDLAKEAQILVNDEENEKIYLKRSYDTIRFFNSTYGIFENVLKCEQLEQQLLSVQGRKMKFHKKNGALVRFYYPNLRAASRYFYSKKKYKEAESFTRMVLDMPLEPIWGDHRQVTESDDYVDNGYLFMRSAYFNKDYDQVERYKDLVMSDSAYRRDAYEMMASSAIALKDTVKYLGYLRQGLREYPLAPFFFTRMTDNMTDKKNYRGALALADSMLTVDDDNLLFLVSKNVALLNLQRNMEAIEVAQHLIEVDSAVMVPYYYIGAAYCNLANNLVLPTNINSSAYKVVAEKRKYYYAEARPYLERYRLTRPEEKQRWAPLLYRVYLSLNMGKKFAEIEKILSEM